MNKVVILGVAAVAAAGAGYWILNNSGNESAGGGGGGGTVAGDCAAICAGANAACPSLADKEICMRNCPEMDEKTKNDIKALTSCEMLAQNLELVAALAIPAAKQPELSPAKNNCEAACNNYVGKCLTLVPNASQELFNEGRSSCIGECAGWDANKTECMAAAADCPAMTEVCGL